MQTKCMVRFRGKERFMGKVHSDSCNTGLLTRIALGSYLWRPL